jgi:hypothetical protein
MWLGYTHGTVGGDDRRFLQEYCGFVFGCSFRLLMIASTFSQSFRNSPKRQIENKLEKKGIAQLSNITYSSHKRIRSLNRAAVPFAPFECPNAHIDTPTYNPKLDFCTILTSRRETSHRIEPSTYIARIRPFAQSRKIGV